MIFSFSQYASRWALMNSLPLSESMPTIGNGNAAVISTKAANTHFCALFLTARVSVQPLKTSVTVRVWQKSPRGSPPSWPTRSISTNPGRSSSQSAQVRIGIWDLASDPGLVPDRPLIVSFARSGASRRSMVAADIPTSWARTAGGRSSSPARSRAAVISGRNGAIRFPAGASITAHNFRNAPITSSPYSGGRPRRGTGSRLGPSVRRRAIRA